MFFFKVQNECGVEQWVEHGYRIHFDVGPQESWKPSGTVEEAKLATEKLAAKLAPFEVKILPDVVFHDTWNQNVLMYVEDIGAPSQQQKSWERIVETNPTRVVTFVCGNVWRTATLEQDQQTSCETLGSATRIFHTHQKQIITCIFTLIYNIIYIYNINIDYVYEVNE